MGTRVRIAFGECAADFGTRELFRAGEKAHLSPKAFLLLQLLVENRPNAVAKEVIHERIWPRSFVSEATLASLIAEIREAIGESAESARYIRTVHGFGYAFAGEAIEKLPLPIARESGWLLLWDDREIPLGEGETIIGRDHTAGVCIASEKVSRRHARLRITGGTATIEDLGSKNGTYVRGEKISTPQALRDQDSIRIGAATLVARNVSYDDSTRSELEPPSLKGASSPEPPRRRGKRETP